MANCNAGLLLVFIVESGLGQASILESAAEWSAARKNQAVSLTLARAVSYSFINCWNNCSTGRIDLINPAP